MNFRTIAAAGAILAAIGTGSAAQAAGLPQYPVVGQVDSAYGRVTEVQTPEGLALLVPTAYGNTALVYTAPTGFNPLADAVQAPVIQRYSENTVAPTPEEVAHNPFLQ